ncbi:MAG: carboxypeptidase-like regulatory domain-containing protein [Acetivibrionales bacterium]|jgi:hypothetical protein
MTHKPIIGILGKNIEIFRSDEAGEFQWESSSYGVFTISSYIQWYKETVYGDLNFSSNEYAFEGIEIILEPLENPCSIKGTVTDTEGNPVYRQSVSLSSHSHNLSYSVLLAEDGSYSFNGIPAGKYTVLAGGFDYTKASSNVTLSQGEDVTVNFILEKKP